MKIKLKKYIKIIKLYNKVTTCHFSYSFHKNFKNTLAYFSIWPDIECIRTPICRSLKVFIFAIEELRFQFIVGEKLSYTAGAKCAVNISFALVF